MTRATSAPAQSREAPLAVVDTVRRSELAGKLSPRAAAVVLEQAGRYASTIHSNLVPVRGFMLPATRRRLVAERVGAVTNAVLKLAALGSITRQGGVEISLHEAEPGTRDPRRLQARTMIPGVTITGWHAAVSESGAETAVRLTATKNDVFRDHFGSERTYPGGPGESYVSRSFRDTRGLPETLPDSAIAGEGQVEQLQLYGSVMIDLVNTAAEAPGAFDDNTPYQMYTWYNQQLRPEAPIAEIAP